jgi:hypothetical protein
LTTNINVYVCLSSLIQNQRADPVSLSSHLVAETPSAPVAVAPPVTDTAPASTLTAGATTGAVVGVAAGAVTAGAVESGVDPAGTVTGVSVATGVSVETESFFWQAVARPARSVSESRKRILLVLCLIKPA